MRRCSREYQASLTNTSDSPSGIFKCFTAKCTLINYTDILSGVNRFHVLLVIFLREKCTTTGWSCFRKFPLLKKTFYEPPFSAVYYLPFTAFYIFTFSILLLYLSQTPPQAPALSDRFFQRSRSPKPLDRCKTTIVANAVVV